MKWMLSALLAALFGTGCVSDGGTTDILLGVDLVVATNNPDSFTIAGMSTSFSGSRSYSWSCSKGQANLSIGTTLTHGSIRLEAFDSTGTLVHDNTYEATLIGGVDAVTRSGAAAGTWTLTFTFDHALWTGALTVTADTLNDADRISIGGTGALDVSWIYQPGWDTNPVHVSIGGMSSGSVRVRLWDGTGVLVFDQTATGVSALNLDATGAAGVWTVQLDFDHAVSVGGITLSQT